MSNLPRNPTLEVITALNNQIWESYASVSLASWPWPVTIYREEEQVAPAWDEWRTHAKQMEDGSFKRSAVRFSHKVQAQIHALRNSQADIVIWLDADVEFFRVPTDEELKAVLPHDDEAVTFLDRSAVMVENSLGMHAETGWLAWNRRHPAVEEFLLRWERIYLDNLLWSLPQWHDAWVWDWLRRLTALPARSISQNSTNSNVWPDSLLGAWSFHHKGPRKTNLSNPNPPSPTPPEIGSGSTTRIGIFLPRLDLPWKLSAPPPDVALPTLKDDTLQLRLHWKAFTARLANTLQKKGLAVEVFEWPAWKIDAASIDKTGVQLAFVPHRCDLDFIPGKAKILFFMQEYFQWVFVVDPKGWSAAASGYPFSISALKPKRRGLFREYRRQLVAGQLSSKFSQMSPRGRFSLALSREIPWKGYVFFPLQIPHDQAIRYFSDYSEDSIVKAVLEWSRRSGIPVVFKPHPIGKELMYQFEQQVRAAGCYWSTANVHDLIKHSSAVFTLNSGVGFEALFHLKPIVTFARTEYDAVTIHGHPHQLDQAWHTCQSLRRNELKKHYRKFIDWFLSSYAVDLSNAVDSQKRFDLISKTVLEMLDPPAHQK